MTDCVADASVLVKLAIDEVGAKFAIELVASRQVGAPALVVAELANVLRRLVKSQRRSKSDAQESLADILGAIQILPETDEEALLTLDLAIALDHPAQDCRYLAAAIAAKVPYVTADESFARKARAAGHPAFTIAEAATSPFG